MCLSIAKCSSLVENWQIETLQTDTCNLTQGKLMEGVGSLSLLVPCYTVCMKTRSMRAISLHQHFLILLLIWIKNTILSCPQSSKVASLLMCRKTTADDLQKTRVRNQTLRNTRIRFWHHRFRGIYFFSLPS